MSAKVIKMLSSFFYVGYSPFLPGTAASLSGLLIYVFFIKGNPMLHLALVVILTLLGFCISGKAEEIFKQKDARKIVIDDLNGMLVGLLFLPYNLKLALAGFIVFRIMDGLKPYPIYKIEKLQGSSGIMGDDLLAGFYTNITLQILVKLLSANFS